MHTSRWGEWKKNLQARKDINKICMADSKTNREESEGAGMWIHASEA